MKCLRADSLPRDEETGFSPWDCVRARHGVRRPAFPDHAARVHSLPTPKPNNRFQLIRGTVTYYDNQGTDTSYRRRISRLCAPNPSPSLSPATGQSPGPGRQRFRPDVIADRSHLAPPWHRCCALPATFAQLIRVELDCVRVKMHGRVRSADIVKDKTETHHLNLGGRRVHRCDRPGPR